MTRPHLSYTRHLRRIDHLVRRHGFAVQFVSDPDGPSWAYTIGLPAHDHPETVVMGIDAASAVHLLKAFWYVAVTGSTPEPGRHVELELAGVRCGLIDVHTAHLEQGDDLILGAVRYWEQHGHTMAPCARQLVWSDPSGFLPWEAPFDPRLERFQPLLDRRETHPHRWADALGHR